MKSSSQFEILTLPTFDKELAKIFSKYPAFREEFNNFKQLIKSSPEQGDHLGSGVFKVRIKIPGKPTGKSYGARVIQAIFSVSSEVLLIRIYDKSYTKDLSPAEILAYRKMATEIRKAKTLTSKK
jgi:hypothetical protein